MSKFKVGDRVKITFGPKDPCRRFSGQVGKVDRAPDTHGHLSVETEIGSVQCTPDELTLVEPDLINAPPHYADGMPDGVEVLDVIEAQEKVGGKNNHSQAIKYLLRALLKGTKVQDYKKCVFYITREINRLEAQK